MWNKIAPEGRQLVERMLTLEPGKRISASEALKSKWIQRFVGKSVVTPIDMHISLHSLKVFSTQTVLQKAVLSYVASQHLDKKKEARLRDVFNSLDGDNDGFLSLEELTNGFLKLYGNSAQAKLDAIMVMKKLDANHNGKIDYNGTPGRTKIGRVPHGEHRVVGPAEREQAPGGLQVLRHRISQ